MGKLNTKGKVIRLLIGGTAIALGIYFKSYWGLLGLIPILGASVGHCPLCSLGPNSKCQAPGSDGSEKNPEHHGCCGH